MVLKKNSKTVFSFVAAVMFVSVFALAFVSFADEASAQTLRSARFTVKDNFSGNAVVGASVKIERIESNGSLSQIIVKDTDAYGRVSISLRTQPHKLTITKNGYETLVSYENITSGSGAYEKQLNLVFAADSTRNVQLTLVDSETQNPVFGAAVAFYTSSGSLEKTTATDSSGRATVELDVGKEYKWRASKNGYQTTSFRNLGLISAGTTTINKGQYDITPATAPSRLAVFTLKNNSGSALSNAAIRIEKNGSLVGAYTTNSLGKTTSIELEQGVSYSVLAYKSGYNERTVILSVPSGTGTYNYTINLSQEAQSPVLRQTVFRVTETGNNNSVSGATVRIEDAEQGFEVWTHSTGSDGKTGSTGLLEGEQYRVRVSKNGFNSRNVTLTIPSGSGTYNYTINLSKQSSPAQTRDLRITLVDSITGQPVPNAAVSFYTSAGALQKTTATNSNGQATVELETGKEYKFKASNTGYQVTPFHNLYTLTAGTTVADKGQYEITPNLSTRKTVFTVITTGSERLSGAQVSVHSEYQDFFVGDYQTNSQGKTNEISLLEGKRYFLTVSKTGYNSRTIALTIPGGSGTYNYTVNLNETGLDDDDTDSDSQSREVKITVNDYDSGNGVQGAVVRFYKENSSLAGADTTNPSGEAEASLKTGQNYTIRISKDGYQEKTAGIGLVSAGSGTQFAGTFTLRKMNAELLRQTVFRVTRAQNGDGLSGATVLIEDIQDPQNIFEVWTHSTGSDGKTGSTGLLQGEKYRITVSRSGYSTSKILLTVPNGSNTYNYTIALTQNESNDSGELLLMREGDTLTNLKGQGYLAGENVILRLESVTENAPAGEFSARFTLLNNGEEIESRTFSIGDELNSKFSYLGTIVSIDSISVNETTGVGEVLLVREENEDDYSDDNESGERNVRFTVTGAAGAGELSGAKVTVLLDNFNLADLTTSSNGKTENLSLDTDTRYVLVVSKSGYNTSRIVFSVPDGSGEYNYPVVLNPAESGADDSDQDSQHSGSLSGLLPRLASISSRMQAIESAANTLVKFYNAKQEYELTAKYSAVAVLAGEAADFTKDIADKVESTPTVTHAFREEITNDLESLREMMVSIAELMTS
jgi:hypothetical protein